MAAQIVQKAVFLRQREHLSQLVPQQAHILCGHCVPGAGHGSHIVQKMALRFVYRAEIGHHLTGLHHHLAQQQRSGADDLAGQAHEAHQAMYLGQVAAAGAQLLPDIGHRVQADDVHALIAEVEHILRHVVEDRRISVVQIPLVGVEGGHDHLARLLVPGKVPRRGGGKDLGHRLLITNGDLPVVKHEVALLIGPFPRTGSPRPGVVLAGVVHHKVQANGDAAPVAVLRQSGQIRHGSKLRLHLAEVRDGIAAVAAPLGAFQQGHQMQVVDPAFFDIVQLFPNALQRSGEGLDIHQHAHKVMPLVPAAVALPFRVQRLQALAARIIHAPQHCDAILICLLIAGIERLEELLQLLLAPPESVLENLGRFFVSHMKFPPASLCTGIIP